MADYIIKGSAHAIIAIIVGAVAIELVPALMVALVESVSAIFVAVGEASPIGAIILFIAVVVGILIVPLPQR